MCRKNLQGTYTPLASETAIKHLTDLNVTAVEIMPVHHHVDERHLVEKGLKNYWGYNTLAFFAPGSTVCHLVLSARSDAAVQDDGSRPCTRRGSR